eukprot:c20870_g1_i1.p1 GENE.c20870_g1_i1~~c20870_g1_i1.p1  ORF type:complete len:524 (-),score=131.46 c20870_g1_i1:656-2203(-)
MAEARASASASVADTAAKLSDKSWEQTQIKTFTKWVNLYLGKRGESIVNIKEDFCDGIHMIKLLEIISNTSFGKYNHNPKLKIHAIANLNIVHEFLTDFYKEVKIKVVPSPEQINEGDLKSILGLIWVLILRYSISDIDEGGLAAKEGLLLWCQRNTKGYPGVDPPGIENFHTSWKSGLGFGALIHKFRPDLLNYDALDKSDPKACMERAFAVAEESLGIPRLLDPEDLDVPKPDEKSLMTYLAEYWKVFTADAKIYLATKRLNRAIRRRLVNTQMRDEYLALAGQFLSASDAELKVLTASTFGSSFDELRNDYFAFEEFRHTTKSKLIALKVRAESAFHGLSTKLASERFPPYEPAAGLALGDLDARWNEIIAAEGPYEQALMAALTQLFEATFKHFDKDHSNVLSREELEACFSSLSLELGKAEGDKLFAASPDISFEKFVKCMMDKLVDSSDTTQILEACKIVSRDNQRIRGDQLRGALGSTEFAWVESANVAGDDGSIDVDALTNAIFSPL